jgi:hypothetical protein
VKWFEYIQQNSDAAIVVASKSGVFRGSYHKVSFLINETKVFIKEAS